MLPFYPSVHARRREGDNVGTSSSRPVLLRAMINSVWLWMLLALTACHRPQSEQHVVATPHTINEIQWIKGDMDNAFATAREQNKPVLLYWGAVWCPPCQQLKATVFSRPDFIAKTRLFVPVYLDGDEASAQKWGEAFRVQGYPTLVVLDADKHEVMRIAGGLDLSQYANVLDVVLADLQPVERTLRDVVKADTLPTSTCARLAFNAWTLDELREQEFSSRASQLTDIAQRCKQAAPIASARLNIMAAYFRAQAEAKSIREQQLSVAMRNAIDGVQHALADYGNDSKLTDVLQTSNETFFQAVKLAGANTAQTFKERYVAAMDAQANDNDLAEADHLSALGSKLLASRVLSADGKVPQAYVSDVRARIDAVLKQKQTPYVRASILNSVLNIYDELKLYQAAYDLVKAELPQAEHQYYLEADLAEITEQMGRKQETLALWEQAYKDAQGTATRFQWGQDYASALMRLQPQDSRRIAAVTVQALAELDGPDRIYRRARLRLERLDRDLRSWNRQANNAHADVLKALRDRMQQMCGKIPSTEPARSSCDSFLASA